MEISSSTRLTDGPGFKKRHGGRNCHHTTNPSHTQYDTYVARITHHTLTWVFFKLILSLLSKWLTIHKLHLSTCRQWDRQPTYICVYLWTWKVPSGHRGSGVFRLITTLQKWSSRGTHNSLLLPTFPTHKNRCTLIIAMLHLADVHPHS